MKYRYLIIASLIWGCDGEQVAIEFDCSVTTLTISSEITNAACNLSTGSIDATVSGGQEPYSFSIGTESNETGSFNSLAAGSYTLNVIDGNGCTTNEIITIANADGVNFTEVTSNDAGCGNSNGTITALASGGTEPYNFELNGSQTSANGSFSGLEIGSYEVTVTDSNGCSSTQSIEILSGISLENDIMPIISNNCIGCHQSTSPILETKNQVISNASRILDATSNGRMPQGQAKLDQTLIDKISCWVNDGAPNN
ncbi:MAG: hypothetical protein CMP48_12010 [Rickettsiales bacterium]|nr:hypothetical protein [Rickettsiales bacterium]